MPRPGNVLSISEAEVVLEYWATLASNERIARLLAMDLNADAAAYLRLALRIVTLAESTAAEQLIAVLLCALAEEGRRRLIANTTEVGAIILRWIVTVGVGLTAADLKRVAAGHLRYQHHDDGRRELEAMFHEALVELVADHQSEIKWARLLGMISGGFNRFPQRAAGRVRDRLRQLRRQEALVIPVGGTSELDEVTLRLEPPRDVERPFLEIVRNANLTARERQVIELRAQDLTQVAIAESLRISQARVHQIEQSALRKLQVQAKRS